MSPAPTTEEATKNAGNRAPSERVAAGGETAVTGNGRAAVVDATQTYTEGEHVPRQRAEQLARGAGQQLRDVRARGRVRHAEPAEHVHARRRSRAGAQRDARSADGDRRAHPVARAGQSAAGPSLGYEPATIGGRSGLRTVLSNVSDATGKNERIELFTTLLQDGTLFYLIGVAPEDEFNVYEPVFRKVAGSVQFVR